MKVKDVIRLAERVTVNHAYGDGTYLYDIGIGDKAYSVRVHPDVFIGVRSPKKEKKTNSKGDK